MAAKRELNVEDSPRKRARVEETDAAQEDQERAVGINVYVSPDVPGFQCILKQRYTDFLVNEIEVNGKVLHLDDVADVKSVRPAKTANGHGKASSPAAPIEKEELPAEFVPVPKADEAPSQNGASAQDEAVEGPELSVRDRSTLEDIFGPDVTTKINSLYAAVLRHPQRKPRDHPTVRSDLISEKAKRTEAHKAIRDVFSSKLQTEMLQDEPGIIAIKATPTRGPSGPRGQNDNSQTRGKVGWDELGGEYLHFTLYKENRDTMEALSFIASQLKMPAKNFQFAGTKDRRGVTVQKVAIFRVRAERVAGLNRMARGWRVGGFEYQKRGLELGELVGNEFGLTLRDVRLNDKEGMDVEKELEYARQVIGEAAESFKTKGFLNYYGLQRFGTFSTGTHVTGMKILQGDLEGAVNSILTYHDSLLPENAQDQPGEEMKMIPRDDIARAGCIRQWREGKLVGQAIKDAMPKRFSAEAAIMQYLSKRDKRTGQLIQVNDWQGALMQIQRGLRLMYVHAYQSLVWNAVAGKRWEVHGDKVVEGDLVIVGEKDDGAPKDVKDDVDQDGELVVRPTGEDSAPGEDSFTRARPLSKEEAESGKYDIFDIVLPQPGFDVVYPANEIGEFYKEFMGSETGGKLDPYNMRRTWKDASLSGSYRKMMARPLNGLVEWEVKFYESADEQMCETDLERLRREGVVHDVVTASSWQYKEQNGATQMDVDVKADQNETTQMEVDAKAGQNGTMETGDEAPREKHIAVVMKFQLASSQYATMALRELTKGGARAYKPEYNTNR